MEDGRRAQLVPVRPAPPSIALPAPVHVAADVAVALAGRGLGLAAGVVRRGRRVVDPAVRTASVVVALAPRPAWIDALRTEGAVRIAAARRDLDAAASAALGTAADAVLARVDVAGLVRRRVDVDAIVADVDLDAAAARLDVEAVVDRVDLTRIVLERVDLRAVVLTVLDRLDLTRIVLDRVDLATVVTAALDRTDLDALTATVLEHVDLDAAAARLDVDAVVDRLDLTRIVLERVDLDAVIAAALDHLDLVALADEVIDGVDLPELIRESTGSMASQTVRSARMQGIHADEAIERAMDRLLLRRRRLGEGPRDGTGAG